MAFIRIHFMSHVVDIALSIFIFCINENNDEFSLLLFSL